MSADTQAIGIGVSVVIAAGGYIANQWFERRATRRRIRIEYLLSAYRRLEGASNRPRNVESTYARQMEEALADVHLLGTPSQVAAAIAFMEAMGDGGEADVLPLLVDLRTTLRSELLLEADFARYRFLRIETLEDKNLVRSVQREHDDRRLRSGGESKE